MAGNTILKFWLKFLQAWLDGIDMEYNVLGLCGESEYNR